MATVGVTNGHYMRFFDGGTSLGFATECSISFATEMRELAHKDTTGDGGGWVEKAPGQKSGSGSTSGLYAESDNAAAALFTKMAAGTALVLTFATETTGDKIWSGTAYITSLEINAPNNDNVTYSVSFEFTGAVEMDTVS
jgi:TP901-1 family phage major tail protein